MDNPSLVTLKNDFIVSSYCSAPATNCNENFRLYHTREAISLTKVVKGFSVMKIVLLLLVWTVSLQGYAQANSSLISGLWRVDIDETITRTNKSEHDKIKKMPKKGQEGLRQAFADREFNFDENQKFILTMKIKNEAKEVTGSWQYNERKKLLTTTLHEKQKSFEVRWEGKDFITLDYKKKSGDSGTLQFLCLRRIN
jgi:hypothetical protein